MIPSARLTSIESTTNTDTHVTPTFLPTGDALLIVAGDVIHNTGNPTIDTITDGFTGTGTWTIVQVENTASQNMTCFIAYAVLGSSPGTADVTVTTNFNSVRTVVDVYEVTGFDTGTPVQQSATNTSTASTITVTFSSTPGTGSLVIGIAGSRVTSDIDVTPGTDFTEMGELFSTGGSLQTHSQLQT